MKKGSTPSPPLHLNPSLYIFLLPPSLKTLKSPLSLSLYIKIDDDNSNKKMISIIQNVQTNRTFNLPTTTTTTDSAEKGLLRRRLSSLSLNLHPISSPANSWSALRRSKSVSDAGSSIRKWWQWSCNWVMSRKSIFTQDLEMNETSALGSHSRGSVKHLFYKIKSEIKKLIGSGHNVGLPQTYRYDSINYAKNFDDGRRSY